MKYQPDTGDPVQANNDENILIYKDLVVNGNMAANTVLAHRYENVDNGERPGFVHLDDEWGCMVYERVGDGLANPGRKIRKDAWTLPKLRPSEINKCDC